MLTLSLKTGESVYIGHDIEVIVTHAGNHHSRISINAPKEIRILRAELLGDTREEREWMRELRKVAIERGLYDLETVDKWDPGYWLDYMDEGLTPEQALIEDAKEGGVELTLKEPGTEDQCLEWITQEANAAPALRQKLMEAYKQRDELLATLKESIEPIEELISRFVGTLVEHKFNDLRFVARDIKQAIANAEGKPTTLTRPFEIVVNGRTVETIDVEVTKRSGEEFLTPDSSEKIEQVRAKYLPPTGWTLSACGEFFERVGDGVWTLPALTITNTGLWMIYGSSGIKSVKNERYRIPVSAVKGGKL